MANLNQQAAADAADIDLDLQRDLASEMGEVFAWLEEVPRVTDLPGGVGRQSKATAAIIAGLEQQTSEVAIIEEQGNNQPEPLDDILQVAQEVHAEVGAAEPDLAGPPDTPSGRTAWLSRTFSMPTLAASTVWNDLSQRDTQAFLREIRDGGALREIRNDFNELNTILSRPDTAAEVRFTLLPRMRRFERELRNLEQGTPAISRTIGFALNLLPAALTTAVAIEEKDRLLGLTFTASGLRGVTALVGKTVSTLGNTGVMTDHFTDWVLPWFMPPLIHVAPAFVKKDRYLSDKAWFTVVTALGAAVTYVAPDFLMNKLPDLVREYRAGTDVRLTVADAKRDAKKWVDKLERDVAEIDTMRDERKLKLSPAASRALVQFKTGMGGVVSGFRTTIDQVGASAAAAGNANTGEQAMKYTLAALATGILALRVGISLREPLLAADLIGYTGFVIVKMVQSAKSPHTRVEDTSDTFGGLVATGIPTIIPSLANLSTHGAALEVDWGLIGAILGLVVFNLSVGGHLGKWLAKLLLDGYNRVKPGRAAGEAAEPTATIAEVAPGNVEFDPAARQPNPAPGVPPSGQTV